ncbi:hypothetical protein PAA8504_02083 [Palleronia abyssalis]|uniref:Uncharacterized protein n=1 Tax=Palleronia abyssalis TaxID=1501240 RepID=A0A2R8BVU3_9RHOB|nr:hypothetical protein PAA8504_02083 [Palleronia abyssalis]
MLYFNFLFRNTGIGRMHSADLKDMRSALLPDDPGVPNDADGPARTKDHANDAYRYDRAS